MEHVPSAPYPRQSSTWWFGCQRYGGVEESEEEEEGSGSGSGMEMQQTPEDNFIQVTGVYDGQDLQPFDNETSGQTTTSPLTMATLAISVVSLLTNVFIHWLL